jgi:hypothetical protein
VLTIQLHQSTNPRGGDYEHPEIGHCIALAFFYGPSSVGVMFPDYFRDMPLTAVAFALAIVSSSLPGLNQAKFCIYAQWQFCIEEWANGWRQYGDLGTGAVKAQCEGNKLKTRRR